MSAVALTTTGCFKSIEDDPEILYRAIKKDPKKFLDVLNEAAQEARKQAQEEEMKKEQEATESEFKNPKKADVKDRIVFGDANAPVTIVEYSDFQCSFCEKGFRTMKEVLDKYKGKAKVVYKHLILFGEKSELASKYFEAIGMQDPMKASAFHDQVFKNQGKFKSEGEAALKEFAKTAGADMAQLEKTLKDKTKMEMIEKRIKADTDEGHNNGFSGTPGFLVDGVSVKGAFPFDHFKGLIDRHLEKK
jgi:protein-disulfide isomerase